MLFGLPEWFLLIGVVIIVVGFVLKLDTLFIVVLAAIVTGIVSGMTLNQIMEKLGSAFVSNRYMTVFILSLPVIGVLERNGLREVAIEKISKIKAATSGRILAFYLIIRTLAASLGLRLGGHIQFIRPLILPMAEGGARKEYELSKKTVEDIKGLSGAVENFGNFFGQNGFIAAGGVLLIVGSLKEQNYDVEAVDIAKQSLVIVVSSIVIGVGYFLLSDLLIHKYSKKKRGGTNE